MKKEVGIVIVIIILVLGGAYLIWGQKSAEAPTVTKEATTKEFTLDIKEKKLVSGPETMSVNKGDTVTIHVTNDEEEEFHLHGYDKELDLEPGVAATLTFVADTAGRFPAELEDSKTEVVTLEVLP